MRYCQYCQLGLCLQGSKRTLIYEYMVNSSLDKYIYLEESKMNIGWEKLKHMAIGIARGLEYLHRGCNTRTIHFDIKPHNVLLDEDFCLKIADFGLAKLCHLKDSTLTSSEAYFPNWIYDCLVKNLQSHEVTCETEEIARQITLVVLWCIQTSPVDRPFMSRVIEMLENNIRLSPTAQYKYKFTL
jgi:serine/threonine protein kinase